MPRNECGEEVYVYAYAYMCSMFNGFVSSMEIKISPEIPSYDLNLNNRLNFGVSNKIYIFPHMRM